MKDKLYTLRWHLNNWSSDSKAAALRILDGLLGDNSSVERLNSITGPLARGNDRQLWYPLASVDYPPSRTRGKYPSGGPEGAVIHWTAGRENQTLSSALSYQAKQGYTYFAIDSAGNVGQNFRLDRWGYHAGKSYYDGLGSYVSNRLVGIEVICPGKLDSRRTPWFDRGSSYSEDNCRIEERKNQNITPGVYYKYTEEQEKSLISLLLWMYSQFDCFDLGNILGHDEVSPGRKTDPGGSLSCSMPEFRTKIRKLALSDNL